MSDIKLINGNFFEESQKLQENYYDLILADVPWIEDLKGSNDYHRIFDILKRLLHKDGTLIIDVSTSSSIVALLHYAVISSSIMFMSKVLVWIDETKDSFGNILLLTKDESLFKTGNIVKIDGKEKLYNELLGSSQKGIQVLDPFMGTGSCGIVCKRFELNYTGIEIDKEKFEETRKAIYG